MTPNYVVKFLNKMQKCLLDINKCLCFQSSKFELLLSKIDSLGSEVYNLKKENFILKKEIGFLQINIEELETKSYNKLTDATIVLLYKFEDRKARACNILVFNVPDHASEKIDTIISKVNKLFSALQVSITPKFILRIGKLGSNPRSLKIELINSDDVHQALQSIIRLCDFYS